jgi:hypothetical protein
VKGLSYPACLSYAYVFGSEFGDALLHATDAESNFAPWLGCSLWRCRLSDGGSGLLSANHLVKPTTYWKHLQAFGFCL